ncbi:hypothetical protein AWB75_06644 [Caballeronia catudaia]|uniref:Uncharacterized protein n=1 Tax=Caballeronia catudaia TaxID=1777136 RepID=A0A158DF35_9BURK|nr:hypothetical protein AWB75_06644 [Caballeronia catudaia]
MFLPQHAEQSVSDVAYETGTDVEVVPGQSLVVPLVPVAKLESTMQDHGDVPAVGFSQVYVDNLPNHCEACADLKSYGYRSVGFGAQTIVSLTDNAVTATTLFGGFLVFVSR